MLTSASEIKTERIASDFFNRELNHLPGAVLLLDGQLGAGKTAFVRAIGKAMGIDETVNSPTFNLLNQYWSSNKSALFHYDLYRISEIDLDELEFPDLWAKTIDDHFTIHAIEWWRRAGKIKSNLPIFQIQLDFQPQQNELNRTIRISKVQ